MKKTIIALMLISVISLAVILTQQEEYEQKKNNYSKTLKSIHTKFQKCKIEEVRQQEKRTLQGMRQAFINLTNKYPLDLFERDKNRFIHYGNIKGDSVYYNANTMYIRNDYGNFYNIHEKRNGNLLAGHVRPYWNKDNINFLMSVVATPYKAFGNTGDVIIFDSYTGEMIIDNSDDCKAVPEVLGGDKRAYITLYYKHPANKNANSFLYTVNNQFMWRKDSAISDNMILFFTEPILTNETASKFEDFPLGKYEREFDEKIILPFETLGIGNTDMQITIVLGAQEDEIIYPYKDVLTEYKNTMESINYDAEILLWQPRIISGISIIFLFLMALYIAIIEHERRTEKPKRRASDNDRRSNTGNIERDILG